MENLKPYIEKRPWGEFTKFTENKACTVKIITINPGQSLSLQSHKDRAEFCHIISGNGTAEIGTDKSTIKPKDEFYTPPGTLHRFSAGTEVLVILEISLGEFSEEDIIRKEDLYGRA